MVGSNYCETEIKEWVIKKSKLISEWEGEGLFKFWQEKLVKKIKPSVYPTHFRCKMDPEKKRKFNQWAIEKRFT